MSNEAMPESVPADETLAQRDYSFNPADEVLNGNGIAKKKTRGAFAQDSGKMLSDGLGITSVEMTIDRILKPQPRSYDAYVTDRVEKLDYRFPALSRKNTQKRIGAKITTHTAAVVSAGAAIEGSVFQSRTTLPFMRKSLALSYYQASRMKMINENLVSLGRMLESKLEAIKMNTGASDSKKESLTESVTADMKKKRAEAISKLVRSQAKKMAVTRFKAFAKNQLNNSGTPIGSRVKDFMGNGGFSSRIRGEEAVEGAKATSRFRMASKAFDSIRKSKLSKSVGSLLDNLVYKVAPSARPVAEGPVFNVDIPDPGSGPMTAQLGSNLVDLITQWRSDYTQAVEKQFSYLDKILKKIPDCCCDGYERSEPIAERTQPRENRAPSAEPEIILPTRRPWDRSEQRNTFVQEALRQRAESSGNALVARPYPENTLQRVIPGIQMRERLVPRDRSESHGPVTIEHEAPSTNITTNRFTSFVRNIMKSGGEGSSRTLPIRDAVQAVQDRIGRTIGARASDTHTPDNLSTPIQSARDTVGHMVNRGIRGFSDAVSAVRGMRDRNRESTAQAASHVANIQNTISHANMNLRNIGPRVGRTVNNIVNREPSRNDNHIPDGWFDRVMRSSGTYASSSPWIAPSLAFLQNRPVGEPVMQVNAEHAPHVSSERVTNTDSVASKASHAKEALGKASKGVLNLKNVMAGMTTALATAIPKAFSKIHSDEVKEEASEAHPWVNRMKRFAYGSTTAPGETPASESHNIPPGVSDSVKNASGGEYFRSLFDLAKDGVDMFSDSKLGKKFGKTKLGRLGAKILGSKAAEEAIEDVAETAASPKKGLLRRALPLAGKAFRLAEGGILGTVGAGGRLLTSRFARRAATAPIRGVYTAGKSPLLRRGIRGAFRMIRPTLRTVGKGLGTIGVTRAATANPGFWGRFAVGAMGPNHGGLTARVTNGALHGFFPNIAEKATGVLGRMGTVGKVAKFGLGAAKRLHGFGMGAIGGMALDGATDLFTKDGSFANGVGHVASDALTGASWGSLAGPWGTAIGGAIGGLVGVVANAHALGGGMKSLYTSIVGQKPKLDQHGNVIAPGKDSLFHRMQQSIFGTSAKYDRNGNYVPGKEGIFGSLEKGLDWLFGKKHYDNETQEQSGAAPGMKIAPDWSNPGASNSSGSGTGTQDTPAGGGSSGYAPMTAQDVTTTKDYKQVFSALPKDMQDRVSKSRPLQFVVWTTALQNGKDDAVKMLKTNWVPSEDDKTFARKIMQDRSTRFMSTDSGTRSAGFTQLGSELGMVNKMFDGGNVSNNDMFQAAGQQIQPMQDVNINSASMSKMFGSFDGSGSSSPGYAPGNKNLPRGLRNNNPGNINFDHQPGATLERDGSGSRFAFFQSPLQGLAAMAHQIGLYAKRGIRSIAGIIGKWAPPSENNTTAYLTNVSRNLGVSPTTPINVYDPKVMAALMAQITKIENGKQPFSQDMMIQAAQQGLGLKASTPTATAASDTSSAGGASTGSSGSSSATPASAGGATTSTSGGSSSGSATGGSVTPVSAPATSDTPKSLIQPAVNMSAVSSGTATSSASAGTASAPASSGPSVVSASDKAATASLAEASDPTFVTTQSVAAVPKSPRVTPPSSVVASPNSPESSGTGSGDKSVGTDKLLAAVVNGLTGLQQGINQVAENTGKANDHLEKIGKKPTGGGTVIAPSIHNHGGSGGNDIDTSKGGSRSGMSF